MANVIRVTPEELKSAAARMESKANEIQHKTDMMLELVDNLNGRVWSGEAQKEYVTNFNLLHMDINNLHKLVKDHVNHLNMIANEYQTAENTNKEAASALQSDFIS